MILPGNLYKICLFDFTVGSYGGDDLSEDLPGVSTVLDVSILDLIFKSADFSRQRYRKNI
jgi:hypothetical protein